MTIDAIRRLAFETITRSGVKRAIRSSLPVLLLGALALLAFPGCGGGGDDAGPLSAQEKAYIRDMEWHQKRIKKVDVQLTAGTLRAKMQNPTSSGIPTDLMGATQGVLDVRRKLIRLWDNRKCPSERFSELCGMWHETLNLQYRWDDRLIEFINNPYSRAGFRAVIEAGYRETRQWKRCQAEIRQLRREAANG